MVPTSKLCGGCLSKGIMSSARTSIWEKDGHPTLSLMLDISAPSGVFFVPLELPPHHWSSELVLFSAGPLREKPGTPGSLHFSQPQSPLVFTVRSYGDFSFQHWNPGLGGLVWSWDPLLLRGDLQSQGISTDLTAICGCGTSPFSISAPLPILMCLRYILSYGTSVQLGLRLL